MLGLKGIKQEGEEGGEEGGRECVSVDGYTHITFLTVNGVTMVNILTYIALPIRCYYRLRFRWFCWSSCARGWNPAILLTTPEELHANTAT